MLITNPKDHYSKHSTIIFYHSALISLIRPYLNFRLMHAMWTDNFIYVWQTPPKPKRAYSNILG